MRYSLLLLALMSPAACGKANTSVDPKESVLRNEDGAEVGRVSARQHGDRIQIHVRVRGLLPGTHGMHLHAVGRCEGPGFQTAGGHLNPAGRMHHGHNNPQGPHLGDLGNILIGDGGRADVNVEIGGPEVRGGLPALLALGEGGLALVIHAGTDDEMTDPSGNSGARIACAVIN